MLHIEQNINRQPPLLQSQFQATEEHYTTLSESRTSKTAVDFLGTGMLSASCCKTQTIH